MKYLARLIDTGTQTRNLLEHLSIMSFAFTVFIFGTLSDIPRFVKGSYQNLPFLRFFNGNILLSIGFVVGLVMDVVVGFANASFIFFHFSLTTHWLQICQTAWYE